MAKKITFEMRMDRLRDLNEKLSEGDLSLDEMMKVYEEAVRTAAACREILEGYEAKVEELTAKNGDTRRTHILSEDDDGYDLKIEDISVDTDDV